MAFECPVCLETGGVPYRIGCKSKVEHCICSGCELTMRMQVTATKHGRKIQCPMCRGKEDKIGVRTDASWRAELEHVYRTTRGGRSSQVNQLRACEERIRLLEEENSAFRQLMEQLMAPDEEMVVVVEEEPVRRIDSVELVVPPPLEVAIPELPEEEQAVVAVAEPPPRPPRPPRRMCESGWRQVGACLTQSPTARKCSHVGCENRVCSACRECRSHLLAR